MELGGCEGGALMHCHSLWSAVPKQREFTLHLQQEEDTTSPPQKEGERFPLCLEIAPANEKLSPF